MVDQPFALHHHFYSRVVAGLQGQPYPIATSSFSELSLIGARDQQRRRRSVPESCSGRRRRWQPESNSRGPLPEGRGGQLESSAFTPLGVAHVPPKKDWITVTQKGHGCPCP